MATANPKLIAALKRAADKIGKRNNYQWGHMGHCNCGHLAQELTDLSPNEIHRFAMQRSGDWNDQCNDYCPDSRMPIDLLIDELLSNGLSLKDLMALENLSDRQVLGNLKNGQRYLSKNNKQDVITYMHSWADLLEKTWLTNTRLPDLQNREGVISH